MKIVYHDPQRVSDTIEKEYGVKYRSFKQLLSEADFVSIHVPLTEHTHHLFSTDAFNLMTDTSFLINAARGPIVDEKALVQAIKDKQIKGAALDVYEREPRVELDLLDMPNVILVPHIGSASTEARTKMAMMVADNIIAVLVEKKRAPNIVNRQIYEDPGQKSAGSKRST
jgi:glyoxylate reductase